PAWSVVRRIQHLKKSGPSFWKGRGPMHGRNILIAATLLGFALLPADAVAQQKSLKEQLVGAWTLVSMEITEKDGTKRREFGPAPKGVMILDAGGKYARGWGRPGRNRCNGAEKFRQVTPAVEFGGAGREVGARFKRLIGGGEGEIMPNGDGW